MSQLNLLDIPKRQPPALTTALSRMSHAVLLEIMADAILAVAKQAADRKAVKNEEEKSDER